MRTELSTLLLHFPFQTSPAELVQNILLSQSSVLH